MFDNDNVNPSVGPTVSVRCVAAKSGKRPSLAITRKVRDWDHRWHYGGSGQSEASLSLPWPIRGHLCCVYIIRQGGTWTQTLSLTRYTLRKRKDLLVEINILCLGQWYPRESRMGFNKQIWLDIFCVWSEIECWVLRLPQLSSVWLLDCVSLQNHLVIDHDWP